MLLAPADALAHAPDYGNDAQRQANGLAPPWLRLRWDAPTATVVGSPAELYPLLRPRGQGLAPGYLAVGRARLPALIDAQLQVWVQGTVEPGERAFGQRALPRPGPDVRLRVRREGPGVGGWQRGAPWRLEVRAQRVHEPYEGTVRAGLGWRGRHHALDVAFTGLDVELPPLLAPSMVATRKLRRSGFVLHAQLGRLRHGGLRPLLGGQRSPHTDGIRLRGVSYVWLRRMHRPTVDGLLTLDVRRALPGRLLGRAHAAGHVWGRVAFRTVRGGGTADPTVRVGGWAPGSDGARAPGHLLHEGILGHEDLARYSNQVAVSELGALLAPHEALRVGGFASAAWVQGAGQRAGRTLRSVGGIVQLDVPLRGVPLALTYQVARRGGSGHGAWLHLLTAGV